MEDIKIELNGKNFKYRVNGIVIKDSKILALKRKNNDSYCLPGGHVELGEDSKEAVIREMFEETKTKVSIKNELAIIEFFYIDRNNSETHEISFYYIVEPQDFSSISKDKFSITQMDKGILKQHNLEWLKISSLKDIDFRPSFIKTKIINGDYNFEHTIIKKEHIF